ncbi:hypothetical protein EQP59_05140 [Ornithobacterium rhinotracheale]|uniref:DUF7738 domain-containing protein n=1 Tax=Ornithobacterium rhinotracheale TaxID=28251 RepID=A0A410JRI4_ORNRH|nr:hypothetical protein [Ornithobacterium rhinotracheale]QAR30765.1 hypothetical protein EQP59_05140 [Ornithobacterium rhinotracheale]
MKKESIDVSQAIIKVDSCGLSYKGHKLELGVPISEWEKVLGKPSRDTDLAFVWDDLGIAIDDWQNRDGKVTAVYIFFLNLDSPEANEGLLNYASDWVKFDEKKYRNGRVPMTEERINEIREESSPKNYIYPFKVYEGVVNLQGYPVKSGMKVEEINKYREKLPGEYTKFGYIDQDIDGVNDSGVTTKTFGGDYRAPGYECKDGRLQYFELTYTATGSLEYLKIGYESKEEYQNRKEFRE